MLNRIPFNLKLLINFVANFGLTLASFDVVPLPIYLTTEYIGYLAVNWGELSAAGLLATLPIILIVILLRENLIRGLSMGAIKG